MSAAKNLFNVFYHQDHFWLRMMCALACIPSSGALLLKVYGVMEMPQAVVLIFLPCAVFLLAVAVVSRRGKFERVSEALFLGAIAGLVASFAYDLIRIPFLLLGQRVFMSIDTYGLWILDAAVSTGLSDVVGWTYHYSNGITFGIIYAVFMRGRHYGWAVLYALALETINLISPFMEIFSLSSNPAAIGILYLGHVAYGVPLGLMTQHWDKTIAWLQSRSVAVTFLTLAAGLYWLVAEAISPSRQQWDQNSRHKELIVSLNKLNPEFIRLKEIGDIRLSNPTDSNVRIVNRSSGEQTLIEPKSDRIIAFDTPGIYQLFIKTDERSFSSFVIIEPVDAVAAK